MRIAFVVDPLEGFAIDRDTSFALMLEAQRRGHEVLSLGIGDLHVEQGAARATARRTRLRRVAGAHFATDPPEDVDLGDLDCVFVRKDPPFDVAYLHATQILELARPRTLIVNDPRGLREANEKLYALRFGAVIPPTIVDRDLGRIRAFVRAQGGQAVVKPIDGAGGRGVFVIREGDRNANAILEASTDDGRRAVVVQRYLPEVRQGDRRILLLDGEPLGAILRVPQQDDARSNIHVGGRVEPHELCARDREICAAISARLRADGLWFVGIDVIGDWLTEINVTSPTGLQELDRLDGRDAVGRTVAWIEDRVARSC